jgi:uncharacterized repeat protein (TIGR02543 family)
MKNKKTNVGSFAAAKLQTKRLRLLAIALIAVIGFSFTACDDGSKVGNVDGSGTGGGGGTTYTVTFSANGGSGSVSSMTANPGSSITLPIGSALSRSGYTFGGWNTNASGTGTNYNAGASYTVTGNVTLYANWGSSVTSSNVYVGVVTFNSTVTTSNISNNLGTAKTFISNSTNNVDATALCYAVSKAVTMFDQQGLPSFDNTFIVTFTDGADNRSSSLYVADGKSVTQTGVYNQAKTDLATRPSLRSYAIGFTGNEAINQTNMEQLVQNGLYRTASNVSQLNSVFQGIADSVLASSKNVTLRTNVGLFTEAEPKYFRLTITARPDLNSSTGQTTDTIRGKLVYNMGQPGATPVFTVTQQGTYASFDNPITGTVNSGKILLPFTNLKFVRSGTAYFITTIKVEVSYDNTTFREDTEDSSAAEDISKTIGVVLVIDCSQSLGTAFSSVQTAANNFIDTLAAR